MPRRPPARSSACPTRVDGSAGRGAGRTAEGAQARTVAGAARLPRQRFTRATAVDALVALVEAPQRRAQCRVIPGHGGRQRKPAQLRGEGQHILRRCRLVVAGQVETLPGRSPHCGDDDGCQVIHVQSVEHLARANHVARTPLRQLHQRIATRPVQAGQAEHRRGDAALSGQCTPLCFREQALHTSRFSGVGRAALVDPTAGAVGIHRGRRQIADPAQCRAGLQRGQQQAQCRVALRVGRHAAQHGIGLRDLIEQGRRRWRVGVQLMPWQAIVRRERGIAHRAGHAYAVRLQLRGQHASAPAQPENQYPRGQWAGLQGGTHATRSAW